VIWTAAIRHIVTIARERIREDSRWIPSRRTHSGSLRAGEDTAGSAGAGIEATTLIVVGDADSFPPAHAVELFGLLGGGRRDGGWDGSGRSKSRLAILAGLTHYNLFSDPALAAGDWD
jgi:hypothetical protein